MSKKVHINSLKTTTAPCVASSDTTLTSISSFSPRRCAHGLCVCHTIRVLQGTPAPRTCTPRCEVHNTGLTWLRVWPPHSTTASLSPAALSIFESTRTRCNCSQVWCWCYRFRQSVAQFVWTSDRLTTVVKSHPLTASSLPLFLSSLIIPLL